MEKINIITLGCSKNTVDSEHLAARAKAAGYRLCFDSNSTSAKTVVINTCGFIADAKQESINAILEAAEAKKRGKIDNLFVFGCLSQRYADELRQEIPEVDRYFGARSLDDVLNALNIPTDGCADTARILTTPSHYAYLKIAEGCDRKCGYCAIPLIRGPHRSLPMERILEEAEGLAAAGVKEIMVIAQDTTYYGIDLYGRRALAELLRKLCRIDGIEWIRLHYAYPAAFPEDVIEAMREEPKICKYLDIPLQHISDNQLRSMKRSITRKGTEALIERLRARIPGLALRTTMLVGYPGETDDDFRQLADFVRQARFERLGVFTYSEEEGTYSASELKDDVPPDVKEERAGEIMKLQSRISLEYNTGRIGNTERVIVDSPVEGGYMARSQYDSPEVDTEIFIPTDRRLRKGNFYPVKITSADEYDLTAELMRKDVCF